MDRISLGQSFVCASRGIFWGIAKDRNTKIHLAVVAITITIAILLKISRVEFIIISILCFLSICMELFNNGVERFIDCLHPGYNKELGRIKDLMAGMVLLIDFLAIVIAVLIFYVPFITLLDINPKYPFLVLLSTNIILLIGSIILAIKRNK
jgi:diacylglycerol kinase